MYTMGLLKGNRTKSANIVGSTMHLNPHGDAAIYDTMVRMGRGNESCWCPLWIPRELRQGIQPGHGLCCFPLHRGQAGTGV